VAELVDAQATWDDELQKDIECPELIELLEHLREKPKRGGSSQVMLDN
jgi:hypothetical protein